MLLLCYQPALFVAFGSMSKNNSSNVTECKRTDSAGSSNVCFEGELTVKYNVFLP